MKKKMMRKWQSRMFAQGIFALSWKLLTGEVSTQLRWLSRITASTSIGKGLCHQAVKVHIAGAQLHAVGFSGWGVMALPVMRVPRSLICHSFMREPSLFASMPAHLHRPSVNQ